MQLFAYSMHAQLFATLRGDKILTISELATLMKASYWHLLARREQTNVPIGLQSFSRTLFKLHTAAKYTFYILHPVSFAEQMWSDVFPCLSFSLFFLFFFRISNSYKITVSRQAWANIVRSWVKRGRDRECEAKKLPWSIRVLRMYVFTVIVIPVARLESWIILFLASPNFYTFFARLFRILSLIFSIRLPLEIEIYEETCNSLMDGL